MIVYYHQSGGRQAAGPGAELRNVRVSQAAALGHRVSCSPTRLSIILYSASLKMKTDGCSRAVKYLTTFIHSFI